MRLHNQYPNTFTHTTPLVKEPSPFNRTIKNLVKYSFYGLHHLTQLNLIAPPVLCTQGTVSPLCLPASLRFVFVVGPLARSTGPCRRHRLGTHSSSSRVPRPRRGTRALRPVPPVRHPYATSTPRRPRGTRARRCGSRTSAPRLARAWSTSPRCAWPAPGQRARTAAGHCPAGVAAP